MMITQADIDRFWALVDRRGPDECWPYTRRHGQRKPIRGYSQFKLGQRYVVATHFVLESEGFPRPHGLFALHSCDNPWCRNPAHLRWGPPGENSAEAAAKGRMMSGDAHRSAHAAGIPRGEASNLALLSEEDVVWIREQHALGVTKRELGAAKGVTADAIQKIVTGKNWKHVGGPIAVPRPRAKYRAHNRKPHLTDQERTLVRAEYATGTTTLGELAKKWSAGWITIQRICACKDD